MAGRDVTLAGAGAPGCRKYEWAREPRQAAQQLQRRRPEADSPCADLRIRNPKAAPLEVDERPLEREDFVAAAAREQEQLDYPHCARMLASGVGFGKSVPEPSQLFDGQNRSRLLSANFLMRWHGLLPCGRRPHSSARPNIFDNK